MAHVTHVRAGSGLVPRLRRSHGTPGQADHLEPQPSRTGLHTVWRPALRALHPWRSCSSLLPLNLPQASRLLGMTKLRMAAYLKIRYWDGRSRRLAAVVSHISRETSEMPGFPVRGTKQRPRARLSLRKAAHANLFGAPRRKSGSPRLFRPTYAEANVGHPSRSYGILV
jgi:hypothetical protein